MARVAIQLARFLELSEVAIQPSDQNSWLIKPGEVDPTTHRLTPMQAAKRYDAFAKQLGFTHDTVKFPPRWLYPIDPEKRKDLNSQEKDAQPTGVNTADLPRIRTRTLFRRPGD